MQYSQVRSAFAFSDRAELVDVSLVEEAYALLLDVVSRHPVAMLADRKSRSDAFATPMATLSARARLRTLSIERLLIAVRMAWAFLPEHRTRHDGASDVLSSALTVCIEQYFAQAPQLCIG